MGKRKTAIIVSVALFFVFISAVLVFSRYGDKLLKPDVAKEDSQNIQNPTDNPVDGQPEPESEPEPEPEKPKEPEHKEVRGIYLTAHSVGYKKRFNHLIDLVNTTELNAMVIDVKDDWGQVTYSSSVPMVKELGSDSSEIIKDIKQVMETLKQNDIYPIARIVTFKDDIAATAKPELAIKNKEGKVWRDYKKVAWLNPYIKESWEYPISIAEEAADLGFKEIQFDYVRFPTDGNRKLIDYGEAAEGKTMAEAIAGFLAYARERLKDKGVVVSADIYGLVTTVKDDMGIGQHLETLIPTTDVLCPMVYPSHYAYGSYGIKYPDLEPYKTVYKSLSTAQERLEALEVDGPKAKLRPWLQDFTGSWLRPKEAYKKYTAEDVRAQIQAAYDSGIREWILWDSNNTYTESALEKE